MSVPADLLDVAQLTERVAELSRHRTAAIHGWTAAEQQAESDRQAEATRHADELHRLLLSLDEARGLVEAVRSRALEASPEDVEGSVDDAGLVESVRSLAAEAARLHIENRSLSQESATASFERDQLLATNESLSRALAAISRNRNHLVQENRSLSRELAAVNGHRQQLSDDLMAVCSSQSWRLGYALTWPARALSARTSV
jgi:hypothetical protein